MYLTGGVHLTGEQVNAIMEDVGMSTPIVIYNDEHRPSIIHIRYEGEQEIAYSIDHRGNFL